jgi:hypothetical protein
LVRRDFERRAKKWLSEYKRHILNVMEDGVYTYRGQIYHYEHILPKAQQQLNILPSFRHDFWSWFHGRGITLHKYFHHLNSSQALCFNLFFPFLMENGRRLPTLLSCLNIAGHPAPCARFEYKPHSVENTHFDFMIPLRSLARVYFEIKYTELTFGPQKADSEHIWKFENIYKARLCDRFAKPFCCVSQFLNNYQIMRNVWHLDRDRGDMLIFLLPKANLALRQKEAVINTCALEPFRSRIKIVYIEDLVATVERELHQTNAGSEVFIPEFRRKYFPSGDYE